MDGGDGQRFEGTMRERKENRCAMLLSTESETNTAVDGEKKGIDLRAFLG